MVRFVIMDILGYTHYINADKGEYLQTSGEFVQVLQPGVKPGEISGTITASYIRPPDKFVAAFCRPTSIFKEDTVG